MHIPFDDLETRLPVGKVQSFKSEGERNITYFLDRNNIGYQYEPAVLIQGNQGKPRIWYPDFYLYEFKVYIEYFGMVGDKSYDKAVRNKQSVYKQANLDNISIYPWMFRENWQKYIMKELERITLNRYRNLMEKPYWSKTKQPNQLYKRPSGYCNMRKRGY